MINKLLILVSSAVFLSANMINLGKIGKTYDIEEEDMLVELTRKISELDRRELAEQFDKSVNEQLTKTSDLPKCLSSNHMEMPLEVVTHGSYGLGGKVIHAPGERVPIKNMPPNTLCVIDASSRELLRASMSELKNYRCDRLMVSGMNIIDFKEAYPEHTNAYPYSKLLADALEVRCIPSVIKIEKDIKMIDEINILLKAE